NPLTDFITLYSKNASGNYGSVTLGDQVPFSKREIKHRNVVFPMKIFPGRSTFYVNIKTTGHATFALFLWEPDRFYEYSLYEYLYLGILLGFLCVMLIYNFYLYFSFKTRDYLYYVFFIFSSLWIQCGFQGIGIYFAQGAQRNWFTNEGNTAASDFFLMFAILFTKEFLNIVKEEPRLNRFMTVLAIVLAMLGIVTALSPPYFILQQLTGILSFVVIFFLLCIGLVKVINGYAPAKYYCMGWIPLLFGTIFLILKIEGFLPTNPISDWGQTTGSAIEVVLLSLGLGYRINLIKSEARNNIRIINDQLMLYVEHVESVVMEKTDTLNTIINNVDVGFLLLNRDCCIEPGFTKSCSNIFGREVFAGERLIKHLNLAREEQDNFEATVRQVFENQLDSEDIVGKLPRGFRIGSKYLTIVGRVIRNYNNSIRSILFTITDETELNQARFTAERNYCLIRILNFAEIFRMFHRDFIDSIKQSLEFAESGEHGKLRLLLHELCGDAMMFSMDAIVSQIEKVEGLPLITGQNIMKIKNAYDQFISESARILEPVLDRLDNEYAINREELQNLKSSLKVCGSIENYRKWLDGFRYHVSTVPVEICIGPISETVERIAKKCNKIVKFSLEGGKVRVNYIYIRKIIKSLNHLLRNSIEHGIEHIVDRQNKPLEPSLKLIFIEDKSHLTIIVEDDGRGIDTEQLLKRALFRGLLKNDKLSSMRDDEKLNLIFSLGLSTKDSAEDGHCGYGYGMSVVKQSVDEKGGTITVNSQPGIGCSITIKVQKWSREQTDHNLNLKAG
ncbi:MAG: hypothetical protein HQK54_05985, partial [Oligoflexales bacterium]|nr:hypothetical protein [Oligoflexales bacterium]